MSESVTYESGKVFLTSKNWDANSKSFIVPFQHAQRLSRDYELSLSSMSLFNSFLILTKNMKTRYLQLHGKVQVMIYNWSLRFLVLTI
jgi:hypothetical protein